MMGVPSEKTGEDGKHQRTNMPVGTYRVTATAPDDRTGETTVQVTEGGVSEIAIQVK